MNDLYRRSCRGSGPADPLRLQGPVLVAADKRDALLDAFEQSGAVLDKRVAKKLVMDGITLLAAERLAHRIKTTGWLGLV